MILEMSDSPKQHPEVLEQITFGYIENILLEAFLVIQDPHSTIDPRFVVIKSSLQSHVKKSFL